MNTSCLDERLSSAASIVLSVWFSLSGLAAVTGNAVVLWLFYKNESLRTISNRFLLSLSVADFLVGLVIDPAWITIRCLIQPRDHTVLWYFVEMLWIHTTTATTFNLCCVSVDRFIAICFPFRYQAIVTKKRCYTAIVLMWFVSLGLPFTILSVNYEDNDDEGLWPVLAFITFVVPIFVVTFCYIYIFKAARKQCRRILGESPERSEKNVKVRIIQNFKAIKTVGFVFGVCIIAWMPCLILHLVHCYYHTAVNQQYIENKLYSIVWHWVEAIALTSSAINPWIYYFRNGEFRQVFRRTFHWCPCIHAENTPELDLEPNRNRMIRNGGIRGSSANKETEI